MLIRIDYLSLRPNISAACSKISFSISNCWFLLRSSNNSFCSGVRLSFSLNEPLVLDCFTHLSNAEAVSSYSRMISTRGFPAK